MNRKEIESSLILLEIMRGYSRFTYNKKNYFFKHFRVYDSLKLVEFELDAFDSAIDSGIKSEEDLIKNGIKLNFWSEEEESSIKNFKWMISKSEAASSKIVDKNSRKAFDESIDTEGNRTWVDQKSPNGIIPTLRNLFRNKEDGTWIAWRRVDSVDNTEDERIEMTNPAPFTLCRIPLEDNQISSFYHITSKECFWPILHTFPTHFNVNNADWGIFEEVNRRFAEAACKEAAEGATVWVHDYNLWLVPGYIRSRRPDLKVAFFHHTPFPSNDVFAILPWRDQILESLLCCDVVGFHIPRYTENFARAASTIVGAKRGPKFRLIQSLLPLALHFLKEQSPAISSTTADAFNF